MSIYFKQIIAKGKNKTTSSIELKKGLNIICGPSNTGKSLIFKIIKQVFGADVNNNDEKNEDKKYLIDTSNGYNEFSLILEKDDKNIVLTRKVNSNEIIVESEHQNIVSGVYLCNGNSKKNINLVLLKIFNFDNLKIPSNQEGKPTTLSLKQLNYLFLIDEEKIDSGTQILLNKNYYNSVTTSYSFLLYLLYNFDFSKYLKIESDKIKEEKTKAVIKYINENIQKKENLIIELEDEIKKLGIPLKNYNFNEIENEIDSIRIELSNKYDYIEKSNNNLRELRKNLTNKELLLERLNNLSLQYISDIQRIDFINAGKEDFFSNKKDKFCPYCNNLISEINEQIDLDSIKAEYVQLIKNYNEIKETLKYSLKEIDQLKEQIKIEEDNIALETTNINIFNQQKKDLEIILQKNKNIRENFEKIKLLKEENSILKQDYSKQINMSKTKIELFKPLTLFKPTFFNQMTEYIKNIMKDCNDERYLATIFDKKQFDISINGQNKSANNGKGYRALVNTITLLSFYKIINEEGKFHLPLCVIDSPLKNLDVGNITNNFNNIKDNLFKYFLKATINQLIIIENTQNFNLTNELKEKANIIEFTHQKDNERYGFLLDIYN